jgi:hypothetical protein
LIIRTVKYSPYGNSSALSVRLIMIAFDFKLLRVAG